ncbi:MAG: hypothetical protein ACFB0E_23380 [Leptolyngbyaceae cyanobacterium]
MNAAGELRAIAHFHDENAANCGNTVAKCVVVSNSELVCLADSGADEPLFGAIAQLISRFSYGL